MRVLLISKACVVGAYQRKLEELAGHAQVELQAVVPPYWGGGGQRIELERTHTRGYELKVLPVALNGHFHLHFYRGLEQAARAFRPDVVHVDEEPYNVATWQAIRIAERCGARALFFTWQNILRRYPAPFAWIEGYCLDRAHHAIAGNQDAAEVLRSKGYGGPVSVIPQFGVDPDLFRPMGPRPEGRELVIGYAGRLVEEKGLAFLLETLETWERDWRLRVAGAGPLLGRLKARCVELGISERVEWLGSISSSQMPAFFAGVSAVVLPSLTRPNWKEQFGRVLIEAMACEVPVLGSDSGEIPNVIGDAGLVFEEASAESLRERLEELWSNPELRGALGRRGRRRVLERFTQAQVAARTCEVYESMMGAG